jgi:hypothetical protein
MKRFDPSGLIDVQDSGLNRRLFLIAVALISFGSFCGAGLAWTVGQRQNVVKVVETHTVEKVKEVPKKGCLDNADGVITAAYSEHVNLGDKDNPDAWTYGNTVTFDVNGVNRVCYFEGPQDLTKVFTVGMKVHPYGGEPM